MFEFDNQSELCDDWYLGKHGDTSGHIPKSLLSSITNYQMMGIQSLFENYAEKRGGCILNQDEEMNTTLQICTFLHSIRNEINENSPVLVLSNQDSMAKWHFHLNKVGFAPQFVFSEHSLKTESISYILPANLIKLWKHLSPLNFHCIIVDDLDLFALKMNVRRMKSTFNIGTTKRNFYKNPDHKLKWFMMNWISPGCVGKVKEFYEKDHLNLLSYTDNYHYWWCRLTWKFCESFERPTVAELEEYQREVEEYSMSIGLIQDSRKKIIKRKKRNEHPSVKKKRNVKVEPDIVQEIKELPASICDDKVVEETKDKPDNELMEVDEIWNTFQESPTKNDVKSEEDTSFLSIIFSNSESITENSSQKQCSYKYEESDILTNIISDNGNCCFKSKKVFKSINKEVSSKFKNNKTKEKESDESDFFTQLISG